MDSLTSTNEKTVMFIYGCVERASGSEVLLVVPNAIVEDILLPRTYFKIQMDFIRTMYIKGKVK